MTIDAANDATRDDQRQQLEQWLARQGILPSSFAETHVSILAFAGDRVYKCKKPVHFPFADFSTLERRRANCEREVALNRRVAPDVYLGVHAIDDGGGRVVDYTVEMRRLPDDRRLSMIATRGKGGACVDQLAAILAEFHARAATGGAIDAAAGVDSIALLWASNLEEIRAAGTDVLDPELLDSVEHDAREYIAGRRALFDARVERARSRDGHGDLLADDVFCLDDGPRALDCLEFDDRLRYGDVLADLAFLAMDLEHVGRPDLAQRLLDRYRRASGDSWPRSLEHLYIAYRALVRSKVACLRAPADADAATRARSLLDLCGRHLEQGRVKLVLIGGPPASGKTTLASAVARRTGWPVLYSDEARKHLAGLTPSTDATAPLDDGLYTREWTARTYRTLVGEASRLLALGETVLVDASWNASAWRAAAAAAAAETHSACVAVRCEAPLKVAEARAAARASAGHDASDATRQLVGPLYERFEGWPEALVVHTDAPIGPMADELARQLATTA